MSCCSMFTICTACDGTPAARDGMHNQHEFHEFVNCVLHELHIQGEPYEMSVRAYELRTLIKMVVMIE